MKPFIKAIISLGSRQVVRNGGKNQLTLGDFLSVFLLTRTGLSYLTSEAFGGIILSFKTLRFCAKNLQQTSTYVLLLDDGDETLVALEMNRDHKKGPGSHSSRERKIWTGLEN